MSCKAAFMFISILFVASACQQPHVNLNYGDVFISALSTIFFPNLSVILLIQVCLVGEWSPSFRYLLLLLNALA